MKKTGLLWILASVLMLCFTYTSCDELEDLLEDKEEETLSGEEAFFPKAFAGKEVAAWYTWTEKDKDKTKTEAVYLFTDNTFVVTKNKVHTDGRYERDIEAQGTYELIEGDYKNGKAKANVMADNGEVQGEMIVVIEDGHLTTDQGEEVFIMQDNAKVPKASDPASGNTNNGNNGNNGGNNNQGQGGDGNGSGAFFPKAYAGKSIEAWFSYSGSDSGDGFEMKYVAAIYFFVDGSFVATSNVAVSGPTGQSFDRTVGAEGTYRIVEGDFNTGKVAITYDKDNTMILEIENGQLKAIDTESGEVSIYFKQDNNKVPEPSDPTENHGGSQGGDNGSSDIPAFFPSSYSNKTVAAWYSCTLVEGGGIQTQVEAVFLFTDNSFIVTEHKVFAKELQMPSERYIWIEGSYNLSGDYTNGRADLMLVPDRKTFLTINNGYLKLEDNNYEYLKRDNKDVPDPLEPTYDGSQGGGDDPNGGIQGGDNSDANLVAWYTRSEIYNSKEYIIAVVLLDDGTVAFTSTPVVNESGMLATTTIMGVGTYTITDGDLTSGTIVIVMYGEPQEFIAINGVVTAREGGVEMTYTKQDNSAYDGPTDFSHEGDGDDGDDDGDDDNGQGSGYIGDLDPYFPAQYAEKTVAAWYANLDMDENKCKIQSIFLFTDNSLVSTISKFYSTNDGRDPEYKIEGEGRYEITSGDYEDGTAKVTLSDGRAFEATIIDGDLIANESVFSKQNNADLPAPRKVQ